MSAAEHAPDLLVIGSGPAGLSAAVEAGKAGKSVVLVEQERDVGGACVHRGTIPSKTLRETAVALTGFRRRSAGLVPLTIGADVQVASLMTRVEQVVKAHRRFMSRQLEQSGVTLWHGRAGFLSPHEIAVVSVGGGRRVVRPRAVLLATGSRPRDPDAIPIDHEHILDSDSILSMTYLPSSLTVLGSGVIACEYATIFGTLGVKVTMVDKYPRPLGFVDPEITGRFVAAFEAGGGRFLGGRKVLGVAWDGVSAVVTNLDDGTEVRADKMLAALGRVANLEGLNVARAGLEANAQGVLPVDEWCRTRVPHVYAAGDVIGPPALAASSMEQGRRAVCHAFGLEAGVAGDMTPAGIYTIPEISTVGIGEARARELHGGAVVGRASFDELARGQIAAVPEGMIKLVADAAGRKLLGVQIIGEGAAELIHVGQMAILHGDDVDLFVNNVFNFPTLAEGYRVAALEIVRQRSATAGADRL